MTTEAETVRQDMLQPQSARFVRDVVQIAFGVLIIEINRRWSDLILQRQRRDNELDAPRRHQNVTQLKLEA